MLQSTGSQRVGHDLSTEQQKQQQNILFHIKVSSNGLSIHWSSLQVLYTVLMVTNWFLNFVMSSKFIINKFFYGEKPLLSLCFWPWLWTPGFFFHCVYCNLLLSFFFWMLKLSQICPVWIPSSQLLCSFPMDSLVFVACQNVPQHLVWPQVKQQGGNTVLPINRKLD